MSNSNVPGFPNSYQTQYARISKAPLAGELWEEEHWNARPLNGLLPAVDEVAFTKTLTFGANTPGDEVGISVDGGEIVAPSGADATATALAVSNAIKAAGFAWQVTIAESVPAAAVVTISGVLGQDPEILGVQKGATTVVIGVTQDAVTQPIVCFGEGVVVYDVGGDLNANKFRKPTALTDRFMGVVLRTTGAALPAGQLGEYNANLNPDNVVPGNPSSVEREDCGIVVDYVGTAPTPLDPVFLIMVGDDAGKWASTDGGTSQASTLTVTSVADGNIAFGYDGLPDLVLLATAVAATDADALAVLWNANAAYAAIGAAVGNGDGTISLAFSDSAVHVFADNSTGTSTVAEVVDIAAVAANAKLIDYYSWGMASIEASADLPARAFLRLSRS